MNLPLLEDWLELMFFKKIEGQESIGIDELSDAIGISDADADQLIDKLVEEEYIEIDRIHKKVRLTGKGEDVASRIARKHKILECFFTEMLGLPPERASEEACAIEHEISEETATRLTDYLPMRDSCFHCMGRRRGKRIADSEEIPINSHNLTDYNEGETVKVMYMPRRGYYCRLMDLGILPGEKLYIKRKLANNSIVITVKGCDIAVSPEIASKLFVEMAE